MTIQIKGTEQYFSVVLFIMLYKVNLTFESCVVDRVLKYEHPNGSVCFYLIFQNVAVDFGYGVAHPAIKNLKFQSSHKYSLF